MTPEMNEIRKRLMLQTLNLRASEEKRKRVRFTIRERADEQRQRASEQRAQEIHRARIDGQAYRQTMAMAREDRLRQASQQRAAQQETLLNIRLAEMQTRARQADERMELEREKHGIGSAKRAAKVQERAERQRNADARRRARRAKGRVLGLLWARSFGEVALTVLLVAPIYAFGAAVKVIGVILRR